MKTANIAELKNNLSSFIALVEQGQVVQICKRNIPVAHLIPLDPPKKKNQTQLGCGQGSARVKGDLTEPMIPEASWNMLQ